MDSSQKSTGSLIVAGGNPPVLLQFGKEVLNQVSPALLVPVKLPGLLLIRLRWNHCFHLVLLQAIQEPCFCSVGNVCQQGLDLIQKIFQQHGRTLQVMGLTRTEMKTRRIAEGITGCLDFGRQTSAGATDTFLGAITFFAPALC